jgi:hypothetical protein
MNAHPMRRHEREVTDAAELQDILASAPVGHLALADDGQPYVVPICFGHEPGRIYFHCAKEGRKLDIIRRNPRACFQVDVDFRLEPNPDRPCAAGMDYRSLMAFGTVHIVENTTEKVHGLDLVTRHYFEGGGPYPDEVLGRTTVLRMDVERMTGKANMPEGH